jgi:hypothetical protein
VCNFGSRKSGFVVPRIGYQDTKVTVVKQIRGLHRSLDALDANALSAETMNELSSRSGRSNSYHNEPRVFSSD